MLMTVRSALARLHTRSVYGSLDLFGTFCGNAKKYIKEYHCEEQPVPEMFRESNLIKPFTIIHNDFTFFACPKKVTKPAGREKAGRFNAVQSLKFTTQAYESSEATV
jgi:hypothetical protein